MDLGEEGLVAIELELLSQPDDGPHVVHSTLRHGSVFLKNSPDRILDG